jgi:hypothetical protein
LAKKRRVKLVLNTDVASQAALEKKKAKAALHLIGWLVDQATILARSWAPGQHPTKINDLKTLHRQPSNRRQTKFGWLVGQATILPTIRPKSMA